MNRGPSIEQTADPSAKCVIAPLESSSCRAVDQRCAPFKRNDLLTFTFVMEKQLGHFFDGVALHKNLDGRSCVLAVRSDPSIVLTLAMKFR